MNSKRFFFFGKKKQYLLPTTEKEVRVGGKKMTSQQIPKVMLCFTSSDLMPIKTANLWSYPS